MSTATLNALLVGLIDVRVDRRTPDGGLAPVAAGRLLGGDATGNTLQIRTGRGERTVRLSAEHVVAYTPTGGAA